MEEKEVSAGLQHNLAALRLFLYESCEVSLQWNIYAALVPCDSDKEPQLLWLSPSSCEDILGDTLEELRKLAGESSSSNSSGRGSRCKVDLRVVLAIDRTL